MIWIPCLNCCEKSSLAPSCISAAGTFTVCEPFYLWVIQEQGKLREEFPIHLTNDGVLAHSLLDPKRHVWKRYIATVEGRLDEEDVQAFAEGIPLKDFTAKPAQLRILEAGESQSRAEVEVREGKFHQVKRMFGARGHEVTALHRASFGPLTIPEGMQVGEHIRLSEEQVELLRRAVQTAAEE